MAGEQGAKRLNQRDDSNYGGSLPLTEDRIYDLTDSSFISPNYLQVLPALLIIRLPHLKIVGQVGKEFILQELQCSWPITFVENLLIIVKNQLPASVSGLKRFVAGSNIMIVSPGLPP